MSPQLLEPLGRSPSKINKPFRTATSGSVVELTITVSYVCTHVCMYSMYSLTALGKGEWEGAKGNEVDGSGGERGG